MRLKHIYLLFFIIATYTGCISSESVSTATPNFVTAVLPATQIPLATATTILNTPLPGETVAPTLTATIEGTTTTEVNVRAQPSTASANLGTIGIFTKVQISGQDATGSWYQITYADSAGWVRAEYVQVATRDGIPIVDAATHSAPGISALVIQKINVRSGPGTNFESLGELNPNDVIYVIGKDTSGVWAQIEFATAAAGKGWAATQFLKIDNIDALPIIDTAEQATAAPSNTQIAETFSIAIQDNNSMQAPLAKIIFSPTSAQALQLNNDVSAPNGDAEDWLQFSSYSHLITVKILCLGNGLDVELWNNGTRVDNFPLVCDSEKFITVTPNEIYFLRFSAPNTGANQYINYIANLESVH